MECPICLEIISNSCYANCSHHFCYNCLIKWCIKGGTTCPMCKNRMYQIILDKEFDLKNNPNTSIKIKKELTKIIYVNFNDKLQPGIRITERKKNEKYIHNYGVVVSNLEKNKKLIKYLKQNNIILYLNGMPCVKPHSTIEIIKYYYELGGILEIELENNKEETILCCPYFFKKNNKVSVSN